MTECQNCKKRPATQTWVGEGGSLAYVHGIYSHWCDLCVVTAQLEYARKCAATIPDLESRLQTLTEALS